MGKEKQIDKTEKFWILSPLSQLWEHNGNSWLEEQEGKAWGFQKSTDILNGTL